MSCASDRVLADPETRKIGAREGVPDEVLSWAGRDASNRRQAGQTQEGELWTHLSSTATCRSIRSLQCYAPQRPNVAKCQGKYVMLSASDSLRLEAGDEGFFVREAHHRVANSLQLASSFLRVRACRASSSEVRTELSELACRITALGLIHHRLCRRDDNALVNLNEYIEVLCCEIGASIMSYLRIASSTVAKSPCAPSRFRNVMNAYTLSYPTMARDSAPATHC
jgi:two-component sensor histidine kinase